MLPMPNKFKVTFLQASTKNNYFKETKNQKSMQDISHRELCQQLRDIFEGVHHM